MAAGMGIVLVSLIIIIPLFALFVYLLILAVRALRKYIKSGPARKEAKTVRTTLGEMLRENRVRTLADACGLLAGRYGFLCQYDRTSGFDTVWSTACALRARKLLLCEGNPSRCSFTEAQML